jgi:CheY-like chemotaxis protein
MSHEVRTPMTGILLSAELLLSSDLPPDIEAQVRDIQSGAKAMVAILDDVLDFARVEAGIIEVQKEPFSLPDLVRSTVYLVNSKAQAKGLELETVVEPELPTWVRGDVVRIRQVLSNLLDNAVKFSDTGKIIISVGYAETAATDSRLIRFAVADSGPGISVENRERIFERFFQEDAASTRRHGGVGLGLAIVQSLVRLMGGEVSVDSEEGKGSTFWFTLPLEPGEMPQDNMAGISATALKGLRILLVDDNEMNRRITASLLDRMGATADAAADGWEALRKLAHTEYDIVLMDVQMPGLNGCETVQLLRSEQGAARNRDVFVVALTAGALADERERCLAAGMNGYLTKPFSAAQLLAILTNQAKTQPQELTTAREVFDAGKLRENVGGNDAAYTECIKLFPTATGPILTKLGEAVRCGDCGEGARLAHTLKGAAATFAAARLHRAAGILEAGLLTEVGDSLESLRAVEEEYHKLLDSIKDAKLA